MSEKAVIFLEEESAYEFIRTILVRLNLHHKVRLVSHQGVGDLIRSISNKTRSHPDPDVKFLVILDADNQNCQNRKRAVISKVDPNRVHLTTVRIVCQMLEAWYVAQPEALHASRLLKATLPSRLVNRDPDEIQNPKKELKKYMNLSSQKEIARRIATNIDISATKSKSFVHAIRSLKMICS
jgi:hypothetical protein